MVVCNACWYGLIVVGVVFGLDGSQPVLFLFLLPFFGLDSFELILVQEILCSLALAISTLIAYAFLDATGTRPG